ncbi:hypothetical protein EV356DRAFT_536204 [Viridothelium virens]|uniref:Uncharacterized protein n=1 Tax=Viridothelium virens TaxID=1048519 RepID=A0A6A6GYP2_VIRVR|nr:hypothetical protein EV356DRAFT_536204 [Viridothelium virens]
MQLKVYAALVLGLPAFSAALPHFLNDRGIEVGNVFTRPSAAKDGYEGDRSTIEKREIGTGNFLIRSNGATQDDHETPGTETEKCDYSGIEGRGLEVGNVLGRPSETTGDGYETPNSEMKKRGLTVGNVFTRPSATAEEGYETDEIDTTAA